MHTHAEKTQENKHKTAAAGTLQKKKKSAATFQFENNRPEALTQRKFQAMADNYTAQQLHPIQKKENKTGLPDNLKAGVENLSGHSMDDVKVHYNSDKPDRLNAHAYAQGTDIHLAPGQEKHLPHEAWHVVQQKQRRVNPTLQTMSGVSINDNASLEREADVMGAKTIQNKNQETGNLQNSSGSGSVHAPVQRIMKKMGVDKEKYKQMLRSTVYLYAEFDGKPVGDTGIFSTSKDGHAEDNLIAAIKHLGLQKGSLVVYLSTSPCSSTFCTRNDGVEGCHEKLSGLGSLGISLSVNADHLYQPQEVGAMERSIDMPTGYSSFSALATSDYGLKVSHLPKKYHDDDYIVKGSVAQLKKR